MTGMRAGAAAAIAFVAAIGAGAATSWAAEGGVGMPQLNHRDFAPQLFWLVVTFAALYWIMSRIALPRLGEVLEARDQRISHDLDRAGALKREADEVKAAYEQALGQARANSAGLRRDVENTAATRAAEAHGRLAGQLAERVKSAEARIAAAREAAMANIATIAAEGARAAVGRLAGLDVAPEEAERAARAALAQRRGS